MTPANAAFEKEALRQQMLLRALLGDARPGVVTGWLRAAPRGPRSERGLAAYRANAAALAERALAAAYPTLQQLLGEDSFAALARDFWRQQPPADGDMALWGDELPGFVAAAPTLADEPYLPDVARLEWAVHRLQTAADAPAAQEGGPAGVQLLASEDPAQLVLHGLPGSVLIVSPHPIVSIWLAHRSDAADRFAPVRAAFAAAVGEQAWVTRRGWAPVVRCVGKAEARFLATVLAGGSLAAALQAGRAEFDFPSWLVAALQQPWLLAVTVMPAEQGTPQ